MKKLLSVVLVGLAIFSSNGQGAHAQLTKAFNGIYCLAPEAMPGNPVDLNGSSISSLWQANYIAGMALRTTWPVIQPSKGSYDWSFFDQGLSLAQKNNKKISLSVAAGGFSPSWVINEGAAYLNVTIQASYSPQPVTLQVVSCWDPTFQKEWSPLIQSMAARYDGNPNIGYVYVGGPGIYIETYVAQNQQDYNTFVAAGGFPKWIQGAEAVIDMYGSAFKKTPFIMAVTNPVSQIPSAQAAGQSAVQTVVNYGLAKYRGRFGIANHGLDDTSATTGSTYFVNQMISQNANTTPVGFQTVSAATNNGSTSSVGNLNTAVSGGIKLGGDYIEIYQSDCLNSQYTSMLSRANALLKQN